LSAKLMPTFDREVSRGQRDGSLWPYSRFCRPEQLLFFPSSSSIVRRRWVDNIRMDLGEVGWGDVDWIGLAQDRGRWRALVNPVSNLRVP
jgi:hypothetical protein